MTFISGLELDGWIQAAYEVHHAETISGVLCWDEAKVLIAAAIAEELGLAGPGLQAMNRCRDKYDERSHFDSEGIAQPKFIAVGNIAEALKAAESVGYPVVLKPRSAAASLGVVVVSNAAELVERYSMSHEATIAGAPTHQKPVLVEEYVSGPEVSVDSVVEDGVATVQVVARKSVGFEPFFEEVGHAVNSADPLLTDSSFIAFVNDLHTALGLKWGWTHVEIKLTASGPVLIEVNARLGGGLIPRLALLACNIDMAGMAADAACGITRPKTERVEKPAKVAAMRFLYSDYDNVVVKSVKFDVDQLPAEIVHTVVFVQEGDVLRHPPEGLFSGRVAAVLVLSTEGDKIERSLDEAVRAMRLDVAPSA